MAFRAASAVLWIQAAVCPIFVTGAFLVGISVRAFLLFAHANDPDDSIQFSHPWRKAHGRLEFCGFPSHRRSAGAAPHLGGGLAAMAWSAARRCLACNRA